MVILLNMQTLDETCYTQNVSICSNCKKYIGDARKGYRTCIDCFKFDGMCNIAGCSQVSSLFDQRGDWYCLKHFRDNYLTNKPINPL